MEFINIEKDKVYDYLKEKEPLNVAFHRDADGCFSTSLLATIFKIKYIYAPDKFQDYLYYLEEQTNSKLPISVAVDLGQSLHKEYKNLVIDHHAHDEPWYPLIWDRIPTGLIIYNLFKDKIPENKKWYVVGALVGDGQPELIPDEIWDKYPELLETSHKLYETYGQLKFSRPFPIYKLLSSPINASCRLGNASEAVKQIVRAKHPKDILNNKAFLSDKETIDKERRRIISEYTPIDINHYVTVMVIESNAWMVGRIASELRNVDNTRTYIVINPRKEEMSIRGELAMYIGNKLNKSGFKCGGHPGIIGATFSKNHSIRDFLNTLRSII